MGESLDYTPRPPKAGRKPAGTSERRPDDTLRPARRERPGRAPSPSRPTRKGKGRFLGSKAFWRLAAVAGLILLVGVPVLADLMQGQVGEVLDFDGLVAQGNAYYDEGLRAWNQGNRDRASQMFARAADSYERALALRPADTGVRTILGAVYYQQGEVEGNPALVEKAVQTWQVALSYKPDEPQVLLYLGIGYRDLGRKEEALAMWRRVIEVAPESAYAQKAQSLIEQYRE